MKFIKRFEIKRGGLALLLMAGMPGVSYGEDATSAKDDVVETGKVFNVAARDPFWPVGYEPEKPIVVEDVKSQMLVDKNWDEAMKQVVVQGVSCVSGEYYAIINTEAKRVGESVSVEYGGMRYTWRVDDITPPGSVKLRRVSAE